MGQHFGTTYGTVLQCWASLVAIRLRAPENKGDKCSAHSIYITGRLVRFPLLGCGPSENENVIVQDSVTVLGKFGGNPSVGGREKLGQSVTSVGQRTELVTQRGDQLNEHTHEAGIHLRMHTI